MSTTFDSSRKSVIEYSPKSAFKTSTADFKTSTADFKLSTADYKNSKATGSWVENESSLTSGIAENSISSSASSSVSAAIMDELTNVLRGPSALVRYFYNNR